MEKFTALLLVVFITALTFTSCSSAVYVRGDLYMGFEFAQETNAKVSSNKLFFDKNDVTLDISLGFYKLDHLTLEQAKGLYDFIILESGETPEYDIVHHFQHTYAVYLSKSKELIFKEDNSGKVVDYENKVNAQLIKYINYDNSFSTNYGYEISITSINYNHSEKLTIPSNLFDSSSDYVYIHVARFCKDVDNDTMHLVETTTVDIEYRLIDDNTVILLND